MNPEIHFTFGPATSDDKTLRAVIAAGAHVCRINLSHTQPQQLPELFARVRAAAAAEKRTVRIGADIRGRKIRIGPLPGGQLELRAGDVFELVPVLVDDEQPGGPSHASVNCPVLGRSAQVGDRVLLHDGALRLRVEEVGDSRVRCRVEVGGPLPQRTGLSLPGRRLHMPSLTGKDEADLDAIAPLKPDLVYLSFVETADDIHQLREAVARRNFEVPVIAKIERAVALDRIDEIAAMADGLCLARGDLGVEVDLPQLPHIQRQLGHLAEARRWRLLLAGEVMLSMLGRPVPTRAEVTDVMTAVENGYAGFVLSDETAVGCAPAEAVSWLRRIADAQTVAI